MIMCTTRSKSIFAWSLFWVLLGFLPLSTKCQVPPNDSCEDAILLDFAALSSSSTVLELSGTTVNATNDYTNICGDNLSDEPTVWYKYATSASSKPKVVTVSTCNSGTDFDTALTVYQGPLCDSPQCVGGVDDDSECSHGTERYHSTISWQATPGAVYYVLVHGSESHHSGDFELTVTTTEPLDGTEPTNAPASGAVVAAVSRGALFGLVLVTVSALISAM